MPGAGGKREVFLEFVAHGSLVKATAIDAATGVEVSVFGPAAAPRSELEKTVVAKLDYVLKKKAGGP